MIMTKTIERWKNHQFSSDCRAGEDFKDFVRDFRKELRAQLKKTNFELAVFNGKCHYFIYGFIKNTKNGSIVFFDTSDVRGSRDWYDNILIRTAKDFKDFSGGLNLYTSLAGFTREVGQLTKDVQSRAA